MQVAKKLLLKKMEKPIALGCIGFFVGIVLTNLTKRLWMSGELFDVNSLYYMKYMTMDKGAYFGFVLWQRWKVVGILLVLSTTYLGKLVGRGAILWYGTGFGAFLSVFSIRYGVKGCLFGILSTFPHFLLYLPAFAALVLLCDEIFFHIHHYKDSKDWQDRNNLLHGVTRFIGILVAIFAGCVLEVYVNMPLIMGVLKIF